MIACWSRISLRTAVLAALLGSPSAALAQESTTVAATAEVFAASDTDGFHALRARAGGLYPYGNPWSYAGVIAQSTRYSQDTFGMDVPGVLGTYRDVRRDTLAGVDIEAGVLRVSGHLRPVGDANWRLIPAPGFAVDFIASADLVATKQALEDGTGYAFLALATEKQFNERLTATGLAGYQHFTDGNSRVHLRASLIWLVVPEQGITAQLRYRHYSSSDDDVGGAYFNPAEYQQWLAVVAIRKRHEGWTYSAALGAGQERSTGAGSRPSYLAELRVEGTIFTKSRLVMRAGYSRSAGFVDSPDYAYQYIGGTVVVPLD